MEKLDKWLDKNGRLQFLFVAIVIRLRVFIDDIKNIFGKGKIAR
jgi:hypothetical protein